MSADGEPAADGEADELGLTADDYATAIDYDVSYDDSVAQTYDDGYDPQAYTQFQDTLAPYGSWVDDPAYGEVWVPSASVVGNDFSPYATNGDWVDSEYGWTWVSGWSWGWAPFHFGRWTTIANHGWGWVPGTMWGPSWVSWRVGAGCVGWAPLPPRGVRLGSPLGPRSPWRFVGAAAFGHSRGGYVAAAAVPHIFGRMSVVSNARVLGGAGGPSVRVNVGPTRRGQVGPAPAHLASVAPGALPRFAVQPRAGAPLASRPWVQAGVNRQLAFNPAAAGPAAAGVRRFEPAGGYRATMGARSAPSSYTVTGRVPPAGGRSYTLGSPAGPQRAPGGGGPVSASLRPSTPGRYRASMGFGGPYAAAPMVRSFASPAVPGGSYGRPPAFSPAPAVRPYVPVSGGTTYTPPRQWQSTPRFSPPAYGHPTVAPSFGGSRSFGGAPSPSVGGAPVFGGGHPSFGGAAPSFGGGHPSFGAGAPSFGGGHAFTGGHAVGGGGGRRR